MNHDKPGFPWVPRETSSDERETSSIHVHAYSDHALLNTLPTTTSIVRVQVHVLVE
jgi:hypothetical protein